VYCLWFACQEISPSRFHHNTFMTPKVRAIGIRGKPEEEARIYNNWFAQDKPGPEVIRPWPTSCQKEQDDSDDLHDLEGKGGGTAESRVFFYNNAFGRPNPVVIE
jgi:hypothetical protein